MEGVAPFEDKNFEARRESASEFDFADSNIVRINVGDNENSRRLGDGKGCARSAAHFSTR
jgi:hypothetical protein